MEHIFDVVVVGGGGAGLTASKLVRGFGKTVALVENKDRLGGECTWTGCVPSKTLIKSAQIAHNIRTAQKYGLQFKASDINKTHVMEHVRKTIKQVYRTHTPEVLKKLGIQVFFGKTYFVDRYTMRVGGSTLKAKKFIIATGSSPFIPIIDGLQKVPFLTNETLFDLEKLPKSLLILGGGPIGVEMACALQRLGVQTRVLEMQERILGHEDQELVAILTEHMRDEGVMIETGMRAISVMQKGDAIHITCVDADGTKYKFSAERLLVAVGRKPNLDFEPKVAGIQVSKKGIIVDRKLRTTARYIYACGDVVGPYLFSHMAWYQAVIAGYNAVIPFFKRRVDYKHTIWATFSSLELARSGLTEQQARERYGDAICVYKKRYAELDRAVTDRQTVGLAKFVCTKKGRILGIHIVGERAGEVIHVAHLAKVQGINFARLQSVIHAYPTYAELGWHAAKKAYVDQLERRIWVKIARKIFMRS